jgi:hypothetical protein
MLRPNTYSLAFSTGDSFYFTIPFDIITLRSMHLQELDDLYKFLTAIRDDVNDKMGKFGVSNLDHVQKLIRRCLNGQFSDTY